MKDKIKGILVDALLVLGWTMISFGVGEISPPAGLIVSGALAIAGGVFIGRGLKL